MIETIDALQYIVPFFFVNVMGGACPCRIQGVNGVVEGFYAGRTFAILLVYINTESIFHQAKRTAARAQMFFQEILLISLMRDKILWSYSRGRIGKSYDEQAFLKYFTFTRKSVREELIHQFCSIHKRCTIVEIYLGHGLGFGVFQYMLVMATTIQFGVFKLLRNPALLVSM